MPIIEQIIGIIIYSSLYLYYNHLSIIFVFILLLSLFFVFYKININKLDIPSFINKIILKNSKNKQSLKMQISHYGELSKRPKMLQTLIPLIITGLMAYIILNQLIFFAIITSGSMSPTLEVKDLVLMQNLDVDLQKGDIIMFETKEANMPVIHRVYSVSDGVIRTKGDAVDLVDKWVLEKDQIKGKGITFQGKPVVVKNIGEYLLFDSKTVNINQYGSEMYRASQFIQNIKDLGLTIFIFCILLYGFLNFRSTGKNY